MDIQTAKLNLIQWLAGLQDDSIIQKLLEFKGISETDEYELTLKPISIEELVARAEASNKAIEKGEYVDIETLENENW